MTGNKTDPNVAFSCYYHTNREGENFVEQHTLQYQISGTLTLFDGKEEFASQQGSLRLVRRNRLMRFIKKPDAHVPFQSLSIYLDQDFLKDFARRYPQEKKTKQRTDAVINLKKDALLDNYLQSVGAYVQAGALKDPILTGAKLREGIVLLLNANPQIANVLFDFTEPYKIDLRAFMQENFYFNVRMDRFAYLTGRSLATFKRDFQTEFGTSPGRWLTQRRLEEAHRILLETQKRPSDIYLDLGFEDLSHFSHAFKKQYGVSPRQML